MIAKRTILIGFLSVLLSGGASLADSHPTRNDEKPDNYHPPGGVIPDADTAIKVAITILNPIYGKDMIADEKPFSANLRDGVWTVRGTFNHPGWHGGVAVIEIEKLDGRVARISHGM